VVNQKNKDSLLSIKDTISENNYLYMIDYQGLTVEEVSDLRSKLKAGNAEMKVLKNTLVLIALKELAPEIYDQVKDTFTGPTAVVFSKDDPVAPAKALIDFVKDHENVKIKGGILETKVIDDKEIKSLSALPSREVLIAKLLMLLNSPITGFVGALQGNMRNIVCVLGAIKDQKSA